MRDYSIYYAKEQGRRLPCFCFDSVSSTNDVAKTLLHRGKCGEDAFAVLAVEQCSGRGRMGRIFVSPRGKGIYMTLVRKAGNIADVSPAGCFSALAVCDLLGQVFGLDCTLKWPNDVLAGGKKICGILPESVVAANGERYVLIGTGINVLTDETDLGDLQEIATSVLLNGRNSAAFSCGRRRPCGRVFGEAVHDRKGSRVLGRRRSRADGKSRRRYVRRRIAGVCERGYAYGPLGRGHIATRSP